MLDIQPQVKKAWNMYSMTTAPIPLLLPPAMMVRPEMSMHDPIPKLPKMNSLRLPILSRMNLLVVS